MQRSRQGDAPFCREVRRPVISITADKHAQVAALGCAEILRDISREPGVLDTAVVGRVWRPSPGWHPARGNLGARHYRRHVACVRIIR